MAVYSKDLSDDVWVRTEAAAPREMVRRLKATLRSMATVTDHGEAVDRELEEQLWSVGRPEFRERLEALKRRIARRSQQ